MRIPRNYVKDYQLLRQPIYDSGSIYSIYNPSMDYNMDMCIKETIETKIDFESHDPNCKEFLQQLIASRSLDFLNESNFEENFYEVLAAGRAGLVLNLQSQNEIKRKIAKALVILFK